MEYVLPVPPYSDETSLASINWQALKKRFQGFCMSELKKSKENNSQSKTPCPLSSTSVLLHYGGLEISDMIKDCLSNGKDKKLSLTALGNLLADIENRCLPNFILVYERFKFFSRQQRQDEHIEKYISVLQGLAEYCELHQHKDSFIKGRILNGIYSDALRCQLQENDNLDLETTVQLCKEFESIKNCSSDKEKNGVHKRKSMSFVNRKSKDKTVRSNTNVTRRKNETDNIGSNRKRPRSCNKSVCPEKSVKVENDKLHASKEMPRTLPKPVRTLRQTRKSSRLNAKLTSPNSVSGAKSGVMKITILNNSEFPTTDSVTATDTKEKLSKDCSEQCPEEITAVPSFDKPTDDDYAVTLSCVPEDQVINEICDVADTRLNVKTETESNGVDFEFVNENNIKLDLENTELAYENGDCREGFSASRTNKKFKKCLICGALYASAYLLRCHMQTHSGKRLYRCDICNLEFIHSGTRSRHMRQRHPELLKFKCEDCGMLFELESALNQHKLSHSKEEEIKCVDCGMTFMNTREHYQHRRKEHRNTRYHCEICGLQFPYPSKLKLHHMNKHNATKPYMCEICGSSFAEQNMLANHKIIHTGEKKHECDTCGRRFLLKTTLNNHLQTHLDQKPHTCGVCGMSFKLSYYLNSHMKTHSTNRARPHVCSTCGAAFLKSAQLRNHERKHTGEKPYKCEVCGTAFSQLSSMRKHLKQIHQGVKPKDRYSCEYCGLSFTHSCKLKLHLMKHTGERPFECKTCGATYRENHQLVTHMKIHNGEEPYKCPICGRRFLQKAYLEGHVRKHTGEKPFKCPVCNTSFTQKGYLRDHMKVHDQNRERKYKCSICGKAFTCSSHMRSHERLHSGEKPHKCNICGSKFTKRSSVKKHLRRTHGVQDPSSHLIQDSSPQEIQVITPGTMSQFQPQEITQSVAQTGLHSDIHQDIQNQSHLQAHLQVKIQPEIAVHIRRNISPEVQTQINSDIHHQVHPVITHELHSEIQPQLHTDIGIGLHTVHTSVHQQMHPPVHASLHTEIHPQMHSQINPDMHTELRPQTQHSDMVTEMHVYTITS